jgi:riboflavin synthase
MFTGLVEALGTVESLVPEAGGVGLAVSIPFADELREGESVAVNGACLTVVARSGSSCQFQLGPETLEKTNLGGLRPGERVNLERALLPTTRLGGHFVQGHIDGVGVIERRQAAGAYEMMWFQCPPSLTMQMIAKGSIAVDGVSLTLVEVERAGFSVMLIPHTLTNTTLGFKQVGATVNLETDVLAKYVGKALEGMRAQT